MRPSTARFVLIASLALALASVAAGPAGADDAVTPVVPTPVAQRAIVPVLGSDGRYHAMYELMLTNTTGKPAQLNSVQVLDAADGRRLQTLGTKQMIAGGDLHKLDREPAKDTTLPPEGARLLYVSLSFKSKRAIPRRLTQRFQVSGLNSITQKSGTFRYLAGAVALSKRQPPVLAPPLDPHRP